MDSRIPHIRKYLCLLGVLPLVSILQGQTPPPNIRIYPSNITQTEPVIAVSPLDPRILFASAVTINTSGGFRSEGVYLSTDGGITWTGTDSCPGQNVTNHGGDPGVMIHSSGRLVMTHIGLVFPGMYSHYSTDFGLNWSNAYTLSSDQPEDKGGTAFDNIPTSPFYGRLYSAWVRLLQPYPVSFSFSTNAGTSWSTVAPINGAPPSRSSGGTIATGRDGMVYVTWAGMNTSVVPFFEDFAGFASSISGGATWSFQQNIFDMNGISGTLPSKGNIRVNGLPQLAVDNSNGPRTGWLYNVTTEKNLSPAGSDPDIVLHRSTNAGQTWSSGIRVNQDQLSNGKTQYFPAIDIDDNGGINILYYDDHATANDSASVMLSRSTDGGTTWTESVVSDHRFKPKPVIGGSSNYQGDHIALKAVGNKLYALWMDDFSGVYQVWLAIVPLNPNAIEESESAPRTAALQQNYPNPFNPTTEIRFQIAEANRVSLKVFDLTGREVATLVDERRAPGNYTSTFDAAGRSSGLYFCRLQSGTLIQTNKMLYIR